MRVLCLVPYPTLGPSNRLRVEQYARPLAGLGIEITVAPFLDDGAFAILYRPGHIPEKAVGVVHGFARRIRDLIRAGAHDLVLVHRETAPLGPPLVERALRRLGIPYVFDFDDAIYVGPVHPVNRRWSWLRSPARVAETARGARAVITGNEYLASWARRQNDNVTIIPTSVDTDRHVPRRSRTPGPPVLGWVGSSTTADYLHLLDRPLEHLAARRELLLRVVGGPYRHPSVAVEERPFDLAREPDDVASFDIGLLPEPDDPWTRGKGAFKALLYMAAALPVVASRVGVNAEVVLEGETGYCVSDDDGWCRAIERLIDAPELAARLGAQGRARVEERFSVRVQAPRLAEVLRRAERR